MYSFSMEVKSMVFAVYSNTIRSWSMRRIPGELLVKFMGTSWNRFPQGSWWLKAPFRWDSNSVARSFTTTVVSSSPE